MYVVLSILLFVAVIVIFTKVYRKVSSGKYNHDSRAGMVLDHIEEKKKEKMYDSFKVKDAVLGLCQGVDVSFNREFLDIIQNKITDIEFEDKTYRVSAVGKLKILGTNVQRIYLDDDSTFLEFALMPDGSINQCILYTRVVDSSPDEDGINFLLNSQNGAIGNSTFSVDKNDGTEDIFFRLSPPYDENDPNSKIHVDPLESIETIVDGTGTTYRNKLQFSIYERTIEVNGSGVTVFCSPQFYESLNSFNYDMGAEIFIGFEITNENFINVMK